MSKPIKYQKRNRVDGFTITEEATFTEIYNAYYPAICYFNFTLTGDMQVAQDIAEDTFIKAWEYRATIRDPKSWLYRVARNAGYEWMKKEKKRLVIENDFGENLSDWDDKAWEALVETELLRQLDLAIEKLPPQRQRVVRMLYKEGKTVKHIATELNVSKSAVFEHKTKAILFLKKMVSLIFLIIFFSSCL